VPQAEYDELPDPAFKAPGRGASDTRLRHSRGGPAAQPRARKAPAAQDRRRIVASSAKLGTGFAIRTRQIKRAAQFRLKGEAPAGNARTGLANCARPAASSNWSQGNARTSGRAICSMVSIRRDSH